MFLKERKYPLIFISALLVRILFTVFYPLKSTEFMPADSFEYLELSRRILAHSLNFDLGRFVQSPLYPLFISLHQLLTPKSWPILLSISQILLSSLSCLLTARITWLLFRNPWVESLAGIISIIYIPLFFYVYSISAETLYLFLYLAGMYFFLGNIRSFSLRGCVLSSVGLVLAYLTRSEIGLFFPFLLIFFFYYYKPRRRAWSAAGIFTLTFTLLTLPWALVNLSLHGSYITSSNGGKYVFYLSNSNLGYVDAVKTPAPGSFEHTQLMKNYAYFNGTVHDSIVSLPQQVKQALFLKKSLEWIHANPTKFIQVKLFNLLNFLSPGLVLFHYSFGKWLLSFLLSFPLHLLFYIGLVAALRKNYGPHLWFIGWMGFTLLFLLVFLYTARFRVYSAESFYVIYAAYGAWLLLKRTGLIKPRSAGLRK